MRGLYSRPSRGCYSIFHLLRRRLQAPGRAVFIKFVQEKPTSERLSAASVAARAFQEAYPCAK